MKGRHDFHHTTVNTSGLSFVTQTNEALRSNYRGSPNWVFRGVGEYAQI